MRDPHQLQAVNHLALGLDGNERRLITQRTRDGASPELADHAAAPDCSASRLDARRTADRADLMSDVARRGVQRLVLGAKLSLSVARAPDLRSAPALLLFAAENL